jgi:hypothetical protein
MPKSKKPRFIPEHDLLLDHYARIYAQEHGGDRGTARMVVDVSPVMQGLLGRNDNYESACRVAGIPPYPKTCEACNHDQHTCPGCGHGIFHGETACADCEADHAG